MAKQLGKYEIIRTLGQGAMGTVFLGEDPALGRQVAVKTIRTDSALGEDSKARFFREARACGNLNHPNIVTVYDFGEEDGLLYLAMEFIPGEDLHEVFQRREADPKELLNLFGQICDGLQHAHERGVVHRDIKPSNIRVTPGPRGGRAKLVDFGIASFTDQAALEGVWGSPYYIAPEKALGRKTLELDLVKKSYELKGLKLPEGI